MPVDEGLHTSPYLPGKPVTGRFGHTVPIAVMDQGTRTGLGGKGGRYDTCTLDEMVARVAEIDCVMFPGGYSPDALRLNPKVLQLCKDVSAAGKVVSAICHGPWVLISADLVRDKRVCGYDATHVDLVNAACMGRRAGSCAAQASLW